MPWLKDRMYGVLEGLSEDFHFRYVPFYFILLFLMARYNQHRLVILIIVSLGVFFVIIFMRRWLINYTQDQVIILRRFFGEIDKILS